MSFWDDIMGRGATEAGNEYLNKIPGMLHDINDPYIQRGNEQYAGLNKQYTGMGQDPTGFLDELMKHYQSSAGYGLQRDEATRAAGNTAAAGGMRGSLSDITNQSRLTDTLMGNDMQQWLQNVLGIQNKGLQGQQGFYNQGYDASMGMAGDLSNLYGSQAGMAFQGKNQQNRAMTDLLGALLGAGAMGGGAYAAGAKNSGTGGLWAGETML